MLFRSSFITSDRHIAEKHLDLGKYTLGDRLAGHGKRGRMRRMAMNDAFHIGPFFHDLQVQKRFAAPFFVAAGLITLHVDGANILRLQKTFAVQCRRTKHLILADAIRDIPIVRGGETFFVNPIANFAYFLLELDRKSVV